MSFYSHENSMIAKITVFKFDLFHQWLLVKFDLFHQWLSGKFDLFHQLLLVKFDLFHQWLLGKFDLFHQWLLGKFDTETGNPPRTVNQCFPNMIVVSWVSCGT